MRVCVVDFCGLAADARLVAGTAVGVPLLLRVVSVCLSEVAAEGGRGGRVGMVPWAELVKVENVMSRGEEQATLDCRSCPLTSRCCPAWVYNVVLN